MAPPELMCLPSHNSCGMSRMGCSFRDATLGQATLGNCMAADTNNERSYKRLFIGRSASSGRDLAHAPGRADGLNSIAWLVWHMALYADSLSLHLVGRPHVLDEEHWLPQLRV